MSGDLLLRPHFEPGRAGVGLGHVGRCVALGEAWTHHGGRARLVAVGLPEPWAARCRAARITVVDSPHEPAPESPPGHRWVVLDGYQTTLEDQASVRADGSRLLVIDDHGSVGTYDADLILDQNLGADPACYPQSIPTLVGPAFLLMRREFAVQHRPLAPAVERAVLAPGGHPTDAVASFFGRVAAELAAGGVDVDQLTGVDDVAGRLAAADVGFAAAGTTAYELTAVGTPSVLVAVAANQEPVAARLADIGAAVSLGPIDRLEPIDGARAVADLLADPSRRGRLAANGRRLVDGQGALRVAAHMRAQDIRLRLAEPDDSEQVWHWANDPETRANSFSPEPIPWEDHQRWFARQLSDPDRLLLMADIDHHQLGQIRFDLADGRAVVSFSLMPSARGFGWGAPLLIAGTRLLWSTRPGTVIDGHVKPGNAGSTTSFDRAGFTRLPADGSGSDTAATFRLERP